MESAVARIPSKALRRKPPKAMALKIIGPLNAVLRIERSITATVPTARPAKMTRCRYVLVRRAATASSRRRIGRKVTRDE